jgi:hypothetical protein
MVRIEPGTSCMLGKCSTTDRHLQPIVFILKYKQGPKVNFKKIIVPEFSSQVAVCFIYTEVFGSF